MGHSVDYDIRVGFRFTYNEAIEPFVVKVMEEFHMEPRFDPKTGDPIEAEKVVDKEGYELFRIGEFEYENYWNLFSTLAASCRCEWGQLGSACVDEEESHIALTVEMPQEIDTGDGYQCSGSYDFEDITQLGDKLDELKETLESLGLDVANKRPEVLLFWHHGCMKTLSTILSA
jgi:hypothetical protein